jgi:threonine synthase
MGVPIERLIIATNANDILARAFNDGEYRRGEAITTSSPAMDIQVASNFERLWFEYAGRDAKMTAQAFEGFARTGALSLPAAMRGALGEVFTGVSVSEETAATTLAKTFAETGELVDPHTAVALAGAQAGPLPSRTTQVVALATAHPAKFPDAVEAAAGLAPPVPAAVAALADRPERSRRIPADPDAVKAFVRGLA